MIEIKKVITQNDKDQTVQIALLLDTSNSMDGLIKQAKTYLWDIVNEVSKGKRDGKAVKVELALYEYGNSGLNSKEGFIRLVQGFTSDLDLVSEKLFSLRTNGGNEYCGQVISSALKELEWDKKNMKISLISGK